MLVLILPLGLIVLIYAMLSQQKIELQEEVQSYREELKSLVGVQHPHEQITNGQATFKLWQLLDKVVNQSICVDEMHRYKHKITIGGQVQSMPNLKIYIGKLVASQLFKNVSVSKITNTKNARALEFYMHVDEQV